MCIYVADWSCLYLEKLSRNNSAKITLSSESANGREKGNKNKKWDILCFRSPPFAFTGEKRKRAPRKRGKEKDGIWRKLNYSLSPRKQLHPNWQVKFSRLSPFLPLSLSPEQVFDFVIQFRNKEEKKKKEEFPSLFIFQRLPPSFPFSLWMPLFSLYVLMLFIQYTP